MLAGVIGGLADYLNMDSNFLRLIAVIIGLMTAGGAVFVYLVAWLIVPEER